MIRFSTLGKDFMAKYEISKKNMEEILDKALYELGENNLI